MPPVYTYYSYRTPYGPLTIASDGRAISAVALGERSFSGEERPSQLTNRCATELLEYLSGKRSAFDLPIILDGTSFQQRVWRAIEAIPYGQTRTAAELAEAIGSPGSHRAVGSAVRGNPIAILVPAHRVVDSRGRIAGDDRSARLRRACLALEQANA